MIRISRDQMDTFRRALESHRERDLLDHAAATYPEHVELFGLDGVGELVRLAIRKTAGHSLVSGRAHRLLLRLVLECGVDFDADPLLAFPGPILGSGAAETTRVAELAAAADAYSARTARGLRSAAENFRDFRLTWSDRDRTDLSELRRSCTTLFPAKAALVPSPAWAAISGRAAAAAALWGWHTSTAHAVLFALHFVAGSGVLADPRFSFIHTLDPGAPPADPGRALHQAAGDQFARWFAPRR